MFDVARSSPPPAAAPSGRLRLPGSVIPWGKVAGLAKRLSTRRRRTAPAEQQGDAGPSTSGDGEQGVVVQSQRSKGRFGASGQILSLLGAALGATAFCLFSPQIAPILGILAVLSAPEKLPKAFRPRFLAFPPEIARTLGPFRVPAIYLGSARLLLPVAAPSVWRAISYWHVSRPPSAFHTCCSVAQLTCLLRRRMTCVPVASCYSNSYPTQPRLGPADWPAPLRCKRTFPFLHPDCRVRLLPVLTSFLQTSISLAGVKDPKVKALQPHLLPAFPSPPSPCRPRALNPSSVPPLIPPLQLRNKRWAQTHEKAAKRIRQALMDLQGFNMKLAQARPLATTYAIDAFPARSQPCSDSMGSSLICCRPGPASFLPPSPPLSAQVVASKSDLLPPAYVAELGRLFEKAPVRPFSCAPASPQNRSNRPCAKCQHSPPEDRRCVAAEAGQRWRSAFGPFSGRRHIKAVVEAELRAPLRSLFKAFETKPMASGTIAQARAGPCLPVLLLFSFPCQPCSARAIWSAWLLQLQTPRFLLQSGGGQLHTAQPPAALHSSGR